MVSNQLHLPRHTVTVNSMQLTEYIRQCAVTVRYHYTTSCPSAAFCAHIRIDFPVSLTLLLFKASRLLDFCIKTADSSSVMSLHYK